MPDIIFMHTFIASIFAFGILDHDSSLALGSIFNFGSGLDLFFKLQYMYGLHAIFFSLQRYMEPMEQRLEMISSLLSSGQNTQTSFCPSLPLAFFLAILVCAIYFHPYVRMQIVFSLQPPLSSILHKTSA